MRTLFAARTKLVVRSLGPMLMLLAAWGARADDEFVPEAPEAPAAEVASAEPAADGVESAPDTRNPLEVSREHMERGQALYGAGRYIESAEEFLRAYEAQPFSAFLYNAGVAYEKVSDPSRAADFFARFLQTDPQAEAASDLEARIERLRGLARARKEELAAVSAAETSSSAATQLELDTARRRLADVQAQLGALRSTDRFKSLLSVQTAPTDASILLKNQRGDVLFQGQGPKLTQTLDPGAYVVEVRHPRYTTISAPITVAPAVVNVVLAEMSQGQFLGFLRVQSDVPGAAVYLDDRTAGALGRTPFQTPVNVGPHHLWIERPGYVPIERDLELGVGDDTRVVVELERVDYGRIRVVANRADAELRVDGKRIGRVPIETDVKAGMHTVEVSAPQMKPFLRQVPVQRGQATPLRVRLRPKVGRKGAWVTASVAVGFLGAAIATGIVGHGLEHQVQHERRDRTLQSDDARFTRGKILYIASDVGYGISAALAGLAAYYLFRDPLPNSEGRVLEPRDWTLSFRLSPELAPDRVGGRLHMRF
ncbi:MAG: TonB-dependent receptor [Myxococcaceae bacterium]|nr:TonB-dependent receptor [Myxococcaceae bacterium]